MYSSQAQWRTIDLSLAAEAAGNSAAFSASSLPGQRTLTGQAVAHHSNTSWQANTWYSLDEMAPVIQAVVSRADWQQGNSLSVIVTGIGGAWGRKFIRSDDGSPANAPRLIVTYTTAGGSTATPAPTLTKTPAPTVVAPTATRTPTASGTPSINRAQLDKVGGAEEAEVFS